MLWGEAHSYFLSSFGGLLNMTLGVDKLTDEELLKVVMCIADIAKTSIAQVAEKLEKKDMERLLNTIIKHKELWK